MTSAVPYLTVHDAKAAIDYYARAFGAVEVERYTGDDGSIGFAGLRIGEASVYLSDEAHDYGAWAPQTVGHSTSSVVLTVDDVDPVYRSAIEAGGTVDREPTDQFDGSRRGWLWDPFGQHWAIGSLTGETPGT